MTVRPACVQAVAVLHCLQRLAGHPLLAEQLLNAPGALGRLWACLGCGADHIVAEGARLLVRLFAPAPARHGAPPWRLLRGEVVLLLPSLPLCIHPSRPPVASLAMPSRLQLGQNACKSCICAICSPLLACSKAPPLPACNSLAQELHHATDSSHALLLSNFCDSHDMIPLLISGFNTGPPCVHICLAAASPLGSEEVYLTNTREDNQLAKTAKMLAFPPISQADRLAVLLKPLAAQPPVSHLTSMALLEAVAAVAVGEDGSGACADIGCSTVQGSTAHKQDTAWGS